jgi:hypothetical protein
LIKISSRCSFSPPKRVLRRFSLSWSVSTQKESFLIFYHAATLNVFRQNIYKFLQALNFVFLVLNFQGSGKDIQKKRDAERDERAKKVPLCPLSHSLILSFRPVRMYSYRGGLYQCYFFVLFYCFFNCSL